MVNDPIADLLVRIKNAQDAAQESFSISQSKIKEAISELLLKEGFLKSVSKKKKTNTLEIGLLSPKDGHAIRGVKRVSKLSRRIYQGFEAIHPFKNGYGSSVISTPKGLLTDRQAIREKVGGEVLFKIW